LGDIKKEYSTFEMEIYAERSDFTSICKATFTEYRIVSSKVALYMYYAPFNLQVTNKIVPKLPFPVLYRTGYVVFPSTIQ
jgi:hypothetical protein